jgi:hypothetical protein
MNRDQWIPILRPAILKRFGHSFMITYGWVDSADLDIADQVYKPDHAK